MKPIRVELGDDDFATTFLYEVSARYDGGSIQQNAVWSTRWSYPADGTTDEGAEPKLLQIELESYEEAEFSKRAASTLFADATASAMAGVEAYETQVRPGLDHWFPRVSRLAGMSFLGHHGLAVGDVNGDGLEDLYVTDAGGLPNRLYVQRDDGTLRDASAGSGADWLDASVSALLVDLDGDGDQDLAVVTAFALLLHENDGSGRFTLRESLPELVTAPTSLSAADYDEDGDLDLYLCGYNGDRDSRSIPGPVPYHDAENGGPNALLENRGGFRFIDVTDGVGLGENNHGFSFAAAWDDYDDDGDVDLYVANDFGRNNLYENDGGRFRFADVSAITGLDFLDDGRAFAVTDWDHDGDLDLWLHNRTSPRLRLMLNQTDPADASCPEAASWVELRLRGAKANRDGVGARVEVVLSGTEAQAEAAGKLVQTLYAGDGFQSQSSKWLHFGLGHLQGRTIERVEVSWPVPGEVAETTESFTSVQPGGRYLLKEGAGVAEPIPSRERVSLDPSQQAPPESSSDARLFLPRRLPLPELPYQAFEVPGSADRDVETLVKASGGPVLVNLWASWCMPCQAEFRELAAHRTDLAAAGLEVLALTVEGLDEKESSADDALKILRGLGFTGSAGAATEEMLDKLDLLEQVLYELDLPFVVPVSYLLDGQGRLAAVYRGRLDLDVLLRDVRALEAPVAELHQLSAPLDGRWHDQVPPVDLLWVGRAFRDDYPRDMERYLLRAVDQFDRWIGDTDRDDLDAYLRDRAASAFIDLAEASAQRGDADRAVERLREALRRRNDSTLAHLKLGELLRDAGRHEESLQHFGVAYKSDPENAVARYGLGMAFYALGDLENALGHLSAAHHFAPDMPAPMQGMAWILIRHADPRDQRATRDALDLAQTGVELTGRRDARMLDVLAAAQARAGRFDQAQATAREALDVARGSQGAANEIAELAAEIESRLAAYDQNRMPGGP